MITVVNYKHYDGQGYNIMRWGFRGSKSRLGNPFRASVYGREKCIDLYREWLRQKWVEGGVEKQELLKLVEIARGGDLVLVCCCKPLACHGDVIKEAIEGVIKWKS